MLDRTQLDGFLCVSSVCLGDGEPLPPGHPPLASLRWHPFCSPSETGKRMVGALIFLATGAGFCLLGSVCCVLLVYVRR